MHTLTTPISLDEIALRKGTLAFLRGDMAHAQSTTHKRWRCHANQKDVSLKLFARQSGACGDRQEHYDESIDWNRRPYSCSKGWSARLHRIHRSGIWDGATSTWAIMMSALALFVEAKQAAQKAGTTSAELDWIINIGNVYLARSDYDAAEHEYQSAVSLAENSETAAQNPSALRISPLCPWQTQPGRLRRKIQRNCRSPRTCIAFRRGRFD